MTAIPRLILAFLLALTLALTVTPALAAATGADQLPSAVGKVPLPPGFTMEVHAKVPDARTMVLGEKGTLFVGTREDTVYAVRDAAGPGPAGEVVVIADGLVQPNGLAFRDGSLYVAEVHRILRYDNIEDRLGSPPEPVVVRDDLPTKEHHGWRYMTFGPDGRLYMAIGIPCNICRPDDPRFATISRMNPDGSDFEIYASGIRNSVGLTFRPGTDELWFTNNGRDMLGDEVPPDTIHRVTGAGMDFGYPDCIAPGLPDPEYGKGKSCDGYDKAVQQLPAHVAPLGLAFVPKGAWGPEWDGRLLWAEHGSWNRSAPRGYRIGWTDVKDGETSGYHLFTEGWLRDDGLLGRPVDLLFLSDHSLLVSDNLGGYIYRIRPPR